jgi:hypothetical protein
VLDYSHDSVERATITNWTFYPDLSVTADPTPGHYRVAPERSATALACSFSGSDGVEMELVIGREAPFAGWVVNDRTPMRAAAIVVRQPSRNSWSLATFTLTDEAQRARAGSGARMEEWLDGDHWTIAVPIIASGLVTLTRDGDKLFVNGRTSLDADATLALSASADPRAEQKEVQDAFRRASDSSKKFRELFPDRVKMSYLLLVLLASQELALFLMRRKLPRTAHTLRIASWALWVAGGVWLSQVYFVVD